MSLCLLSVNHSDMRRYTLECSLSSLQRKSTPLSCYITSDCHTDTKETLLTQSTSVLYKAALDYRSAASSSLNRATFDRNGSTGFSISELILFFTLLHNVASAFIFRLISFSRIHTVKTVKSYERKYTEMSKCQYLFCWVTIKVRQWHCSDKQRSLTNSQCFWWRLNNGTQLNIRTLLKKQLRPKNKTGWNEALPVWLKIHLAVQPTKKIRMNKRNQH